MAAKRKGELTAASVIFMLLVIFIHIASEGVNGYQRDSIQFVLLQSAHRLASFVVQGFIFLSGLKLFLPTGKPFSYKRFYLSRLKRVVLPYVVVFILSYFYCTATNRITPSVSHFIKELLTGGLIGHFYFVAIICQFYLLMPLWRWVARQNAFFAVTVSLILMIVCKTAVPEVLAQFGITFTMNGRMFWSFLFYFVAGIFCGKYYAAFVRFLKKNRRAIAVLFVLCGIVNCVNIIVIERQLYYPSWAENFHILYSVSAILAALCFSLKLAPLAEKPWMRLADRASYNVYLIHPLFIFVVDSIMNRLGIVSLTIRLGIRIAMVYVLSVGGCILWEKLKTRLLKKPVEKNH